LDVKVCFTSETECPDGYMTDKGETFGKHGKYEYGWSSDMTNMVRSRDSLEGKLKSNMILFPPN
jgi:hypothetical protein